MAVDIRDSFGLTSQRHTDTRLIIKGVYRTKLWCRRLHQGFDVFHRRITGNTRQTSREIGIVFMCVEFGAKRFCAAHVDLMDFVEIGVDIIEAVEVLQQHHRCLLTDSGNAFYVIDRITGQSQKVGDLFRSGAERIRNVVVTKLAFAGEIPENVFLGQ